MTATVETTSPAAPPPRRPRRRWHRMLIPLGLALLLIVVSLVARAIDQPDPTDRGFLSPVATDDDGGSRLAEALRGQGVTVRRETDTLRALLATRPGPATLFVPAPELVHPDTVAALADLPLGSRLVLVDPSRRVLEGLGVPVAPTGGRWATRASSPDADGQRCPLPEAVRAGTAAADRQRYAGPPRWAPALTRCYSGGLVRIRWRTEVVVIGASDPFRNDRIDELGNRTLATGLLGGPRPLVWLDLDGPAPAPTFGTGPDGEPAWSPTPGGSTEWEGDRGDRPGPDSGDDPGDDQGDDSTDDRADGGGPSENPLWTAFPLWFWALLVQLALAALLVVLWRARRLGPPVPEPLPVTVRSAETVLGRARLYRRAGARGPAAQTLRAATLDRLLPWLNLPSTAPPAEVAARVAARAGMDSDQAEDLLYGDEPATDQELLELARALDRVARTVAPHPDRPTEGDHR